MTHSRGTRSATDTDTDTDISLDSLLPVLAEYDLSTIKLITSHVHTLSPANHSSPHDTSSHTAAQPATPGSSIEGRLQEDTLPCPPDSLRSPETANEPFVSVLHDFFDRLESLQSGDRLSDVLRSATSGGLTATPPRISRPSKARRSAHQHSERTDPSDQDSGYGTSVAPDRPSVPSPLDKWDNTGQSPEYQAPEDLEDRKVTLRWLLYTLLTRGGGVVGSLHSTSNALPATQLSAAEYGVETKETVGLWWAKWGLRGAGVASRECGVQSVWRDSDQ